jgi:hypothetical protein
MSRRSGKMPRYGKITTVRSKRPLCVACRGPKSHKGHWLVVVENLYTHERKIVPICGYHILRSARAESSFWQQHKAVRGTTKTYTGCAFILERNVIPPELLDPEFDASEEVSHADY